MVVSNSAGMRPTTLAPTGGPSSDRCARHLQELAALANLGPKSAQALFDAGIASVAQVRRLGAVATYAKVKRHNARVSLSLLWRWKALSGMPWQVVAREHRTSLLLALETLGKMTILQSHSR